MGRFFAIDFVWSDGAIRISSPKMDLSRWSAAIQLGDDECSDLVGEVRIGDDDARWSVGFDLSCASSGLRALGLINGGR